MDLSTDHISHEEHQLTSRNESVMYAPGVLKGDIESDIIDVARIRFDNDETWLYKDEDYFVNTVKSPNDTQKNIDSRTFTRPKKRFTRPSIERYNKEVYGNSKDMQYESPEQLNKSNHVGIIQEITEPIATPIQPLNFDLTQPTNSYYFENVLANSAEIDSFQNMSPPSLVNSMCSSTFANLMESSFIKNDPILREIRDTDYTDTVLLQDSEPPMFQSITESCSSINSDTPEISFNGTFRKNATKDIDKSDESTRSPNPTYETPLNNDLENIEYNTYVNDRILETANQQYINLNGTYRRTPKSKGTFKKSDIKNATKALNSTFEMPSPNATKQNTAQIVVVENSSLNSFEESEALTDSGRGINEDAFEDMKKQLSQAIEITDLNRLSYCLDTENIELNTTYTEEDNLNRGITIKRTSLGCSTGSADSLDRMSSLSNSSRGSNKMLNMADVDAIVEMQERSLRQVMSTPKINTGSKKLWENNFISPIISNEHFSDSDASSTDEYKSVKSTVSRVSLENYVDKPVKSLGHSRNNVDTKLRTSQRSTYTLPSQKPLQVIPSNIRSSYSNLKTIQSKIPGSQNNLYKPSNCKTEVPGTNLKTMGQRLKGSYTSLKPISTNLPEAPPIIPQLNTTTTLSKGINSNVMQNINSYSNVAEVLPMPRERINVGGDNTFIKPQQPRTSGLPRPTGIPRPASRIPGPRNNISYVVIHKKLSKKH
ncbi:hypothetical protein NQ315_013563 [Exocentrus adspersus]|uniref:Uncharacterized protein n=1 Tax=Exocentrus adspersus TaxID=1586481 RepID=A0AAV8VB58_9CUCU|nr:hypothetical protein NQ315_013563 [Exocentrus adspersus]